MSVMPNDSRFSRPPLLFAVGRLEPAVRPVTSVLRPSHRYREAVLKVGEASARRTRSGSLASPTQPVTGYLLWPPGQVYP